MNNSNHADIVEKIKKSKYYRLYKSVYGRITDADSAFQNILDAIAEFQKSSELNPFTSKYDYYLAGKVNLTEDELSGLKLFEDVGKGMCAECHLTTPDPQWGKVLFTDFTYDNLGIPRNLENPFYKISKELNPLGENHIDNGLGDFLKDSQYNGFFKVPTLRNVALTAPYFHNGIFSTLEEVVHFYNARDIESFPPPEVPFNVNKDELGNLKLTPQEEKDIVAFLKTLTDGFLLH